jgi:hypothetical protein
MQTLQGIHFVYFCFGFHFFRIAYQGKDIVFKFIIKYNSLIDFGSPCSRYIFIWGFLKDVILACVETWD